jgi:ATP-binding cassette subfamily F protein uup
LLVLDEPTNDLDIETLDLLQELLADYQGTLLLVSHDRDFLDRVATSVIASEGDGKWQEYAGGYSDMVAQRGVGIMPDRARAASADRRAGAASGNPPTLENASSAGETSGGKAQRKLSFKESHALKTLPGTIARLETEIAALSASVGDAALYTRDPAAFNSATARLSAAQAELTSAEEQWLELEMKREALEAS